MTATTAKGTTTRLEIPAKLTPKAAKVAAVDKWEKANEKAEKACSDRTTARDSVMVLFAKEKDPKKRMVTASSGRTYYVRDEKVSTNAHEKVAKALAERLGLTEAQVKAEYKKHAGTTTKREIKPA